LSCKIKALRGDSLPTLLFDTGDFLQGNPLADAAMKDTATQIHPIVQAFNDLLYDAIALGNHDFDYGIAALERTIGQIKCPVLSANVISPLGHATYLGSTIIPIATDLLDRPLQIGIIGLTTPIVSLTTATGAPAVSTHDPVSTAQTIVAELHKQGVDIIVALCHFGIDPDDHIQNVVTDIADIDGVDVIMAGHTHETFPQGTKRCGPTIDACKGTINGKPTVMSGGFGQHLGMIELEIAHDADTVTIASHTAQLHTPNKQAGCDVFPHVRALHDTTVAEFDKQIALTSLPFSTAFSLIQPDLTQYLLSCARQMHMEDLLADTTYADLPFLTTAASFLTGSRSNPDDFLYVPPGPVTRRDVTAIYPFNNCPVAILRNGAQIKDWLEASALMYLPIVQGRQNQNLIDPQVPPYLFDTIFGLTYCIDVSAPAGNRIKSIRRKGALINDTDRFVLVSATNRLGHGRNIPHRDIIHVAQRSSQDLLTHSLQRQSPVTVPCPFVWDFTPLPYTTAVFHTLRDAKACDTDRALTDNGLTSNGYRKFTLAFDH
jgi:2',3'-cyclic-nucleotide 2'-phosphodiesterase/3'-nucleotidase